MRSRAARLTAGVMMLALSPGIALSILGLRAIRADETAAREQANSRARAAADRVDRFLDEQIEGIESNLRRSLLAAAPLDLSPKQTQSLERCLVELNLTGPRIEFAFFVEADDQVRCPGLPSFNEVEDAIPPNDPIHELRREADDAESSGDWDWARHLYAEAISLCHSPRREAELRIELANLESRVGLMERAQKLARQVFDEDFSRRDGALRPIAARALELIIPSLPRATEDAREADETRVLRFALGLGANLWRSSSGIRDRLTQSLDQSLSSQPRLLARARREWRRGDASRRFRESLAVRVLPELRRIVEDPTRIDPQRPALEQLQRVNLPTLGAEHLFLVAAIRHEPVPAFVGVELDLTELGQSLAARLQDLAMPYEARVLVRSEAGPIAGLTNDPWPDEPAVALASSVRSWSAVSVPLDPERPAREARLHLRRMVLLVVSCLLVAILGAALAVTAVEREVALADTRTRLVRNVSHELRTPVSSLLMLGEILQDGGLPAERQQDYFDRIVREARRLSGLVENVLSLSKIESGAQTVELEDCELATLVENLTNEFLESEEGRGLELRFSDLGRGRRAMIDPQALSQVMTNLLSNATKYGQRGPIEVTVSERDRELQISVRDFGRGVAPEARKKLFTAFYRERPEESQVSGIGIGLSLTRQLVQLMRGRIVLDSSIEGPGACFIVSFPSNP